MGPSTAPIPITILTGFLGSGKTTLIINLIPQLPATYKLALLKNEFGDVAIDSQLASSSSISGVRELLNGCICCNLVGQLGDALDYLRTEIEPDRIVIETSGSAFPATLALEVNRLGRESGLYVLDGVVSVIDVENWEGYEDTSVTARMQAQYTDFVVFNKWENVDERRFDVCLDRLNDLEVDTPWVKSDKGKVRSDMVLGIDGALARHLEGQEANGHEDQHQHQHGENHQSEVEVLDVTLEGEGGVDLEKLEQLLTKAPKDEVYRIKAIVRATTPPKSSEGEPAEQKDDTSGSPSPYILNWAFGRWTFTPLRKTSHGIPNGDNAGLKKEAAVRMTIMTASYESAKWRKRIEERKFIDLEGKSAGEGALTVKRIS